MKQLQKKYESYYVMLEIASRFLEGEKIESSYDKTGFEILASHQKAHIHFIITNFLRYQNVCKKIISLYLTKSPQKKYRTMLDALLGLAVIELFFSQKDDKMILSHYTQIMKDDKKTSHLSGMVRGILGNIQRDKETLQPNFENLDLIFSKEFILVLKKDYPENYQDILKSLLEKHQICATILPEDLTSKSEIFKDSALIDDKHILPPTTDSLASWTALKDGDAIIQAFSSSLPVLALGDIKDNIFYDLCAAPGGKAMQASAKGAIVTAIDSSQNRMERMKENFNRTGLLAKFHTISALDFTPDEKADIILVDAPCSATGTIRKNPDLITNYKSRDIDGLIKLQKDLLNHATTLLKDDGILIYATCSLHKSESEDQVKWFLEKNPEFSLYVPEYFKKTNFILEDNMVRILPHHKIETLGMDGFFIAYLSKGKT